MPSHRGGPRPERRHTVTDVRVLAALAHPARARMLSHLLEVGTSTATELANLTDVTPSAASYHLRHLESFGLVERAEPPDEGDGRVRWWRAAFTGLSILPTPSRHDPTTRTALAALLAEHVSLQADLATEFLDQADTVEETWQDAYEFSSYGLLVSAGELRRLVRRIDTVLRPYLAATRTGAPATARTAHVTLQAFPRRTP